MKYAYPAIFTPEDDWILVSFPDLPGCFTDGKDIIEAMTFAGDALNLMLTTLENDEQPISKPSDIKSLDVPNNSFANMILSDTYAYRKSISKKSVKKTVSIPEWLDELIRKKNWNLSQIFQESLISKLGIEST